MDIFENLINGIQYIVSWQGILAIFIGVAIGIIMGAIPGLTATMAIAIAIPITMTMNPIVAISMLLGAYKGGIYGGSIPAILIRTPGTPAAAATVIDGYMLCQKGKGLKALKMALYSSVSGDLMSIFILIMLAAPLSAIALRFGPAETAVLIVFSLTVIGALSTNDLIMGSISATLGLLVAMIGLDPIMATRRFTFDVISLDSGVELLPMLIGLFAVSEVLRQVSSPAILKGVKVSAQATDPAKNRLPFREVLTYWKTILRGTFIGAFIGIIPGIGPTVAAFLNYNESRRTSKNPEEYGRGSLEGVAAAESGNNAVAPAALIPLLTLSIPGDIGAAVIFGAFLIHGIVPGPRIFLDHGKEVYGLFVGLILSCLVLFILGRLLIGHIYKVVNISKRALFPVVLIMCIAGSYGINWSIFDLKIMLIFGIVGFFMEKLGLSQATFLIAFILEPILETSVRQALIISKGSPIIFFESFICWLFWALTVFSIYTLIRRENKRRRGLKAVKRLSNNG